MKGQPKQICILNFYGKMLTKKWTAYILYELIKTNEIFFSDLRNNIQTIAEEKISGRVLSDYLKNFEEYNLITREIVEETKPIRVTYSLTDIGKIFYGILLLWKKFSIKWNFCQDKNSCSFHCLYDDFLREEPVITEEIYSLLSELGGDRHRLGSSQQESSSEKANQINLNAKDRTKALHEVQTADTVHNAVQILINNCKDITGAQSGFIALFDTKNKHNPDLILVTPSSNLDKEILEYYHQIEWFKQASESKDIILENDPQIKKLLSIKFHLNNILISPLFIKDIILGYLILVNKSNGFNKDDLRIVSDFSNLAIITLGKGKRALLSYARQNY